PPSRSFFGFASPAAMDRRYEMAGTGGASRVEDSRLGARVIREGAELKGPGALSPLLIPAGSPQAEPPAGVAALPGIAWKAAPYKPLAIRELRRSGDVFRRSPNRLVPRRYPSGIAPKACRGGDAARPGARRRPSRARCLRARRKCARR